MATTKTTKTTKSAETTLKNLSLGLLLAALVFGVILGAEFAVTFLLYFFVGPAKLQTPLWNAIYQALIYLLSLAILIFVPHFFKKLKSARTSREELGLKGSPTWIDLGLAPVGLIVYFVLASILVAVFTVIFPWFDAGQSQDVGFNNLYAAPDRVIAFIALVIVAPVAEETIFRGWLYGKLRNRLKFIPATIIVSVLFGLMHGQWNVGVNVFAMSLVLCSLREITGTTYAGILLHMLKNAIAFYLLYITGM